MKHINRFIGSILTIFFLGSNLFCLYLLKDNRESNEPLEPKIVLISEMNANPYWLKIKRGAQKAAEERGAVVEFLGPTTINTEEGLKLFDMAISAKVNGIIVFSQEKGKYIKSINSAIEKGIPVVTIDSDEESSKRISYVGIDNVKAGQFAGREVIREIGQDGNVAIVMGGKEVKNQIERVQGIKDYLESNSNLNIVDIDSSDSMILESEIITRKILNRNDKLDALICTSSVDGIGAVKAVNDLNYKNKIKIICFDDLEETLDYIKNGLISASIVHDTNRMGYTAVNIIMNKIEGNKNNDLQPQFEIQLVNKNNVESYKGGKVYAED